MIAFKRHRIGSIGRIVTGKTPPTDNLQNYGMDYMFIGPADLNKHFIIQESEKMISRQGLQTIKGSTLNGLSILVGCIGWDMGNVALVEGTCATNQQINAITDVKPDFNPYYVYYWLKGKKQFLFQRASVTRTPILNKSDFSNIEIPIPDKNYQDKVVEILRPIDIKISINNRINAELEAMAKTIYDYWFVQFDFPISAAQAASMGKPNLEGKPYKASGGKMMWSEELKREIPEGWEVKTIDHFANVIDPHPSHRAPVEVKDGFPFAGIGDIDEYGNINIEKARVINEDFVKKQEKDYSIDNTSLGYGRVGTVGKVVRLRKQNFRYALSPTMAIINPKSKGENSFVYFSVKSTTFYKEAIKRTTGTTRPAIGIMELRKIPVVSPGKQHYRFIAEFESKVSQCLAEVEILNSQNKKLTELRDWLLPMLMNGQIKIKDAERELAMAAEEGVEYKAKRKQKA
jgi:type I restriction enzyme, S subunit